jgi:hypothetical protein
MSTDSNRYVVGETRRWEINESGVTKDDEIWDLTGATVTLGLRDPSGNVSENSATVDDGPAGLAHYTTLTTDLDEAGWWKRSWKVSKGGVVLESPPISFRVYAAP